MLTTKSNSRIGSAIKQRCLRINGIKPTFYFQPRNGSPRPVLARGSDKEPPKLAEKEEKLSSEIQEQLAKVGLTPEKAEEVLEAWRDDVGHEVSSEDLRKILVGSSSRAIILVLINTLLDSGAAYGSFVAGGYLGLASQDFGWPAVVGQAVAYILAGYYVTGAVFDFFKLGAVLVAAVSFNVNSAAFLAAVEGIAKGGKGLKVTDKALDAVNTVKVIQAMNSMVSLLQKDGATSADQSFDMLTDLGAYLTLDRASKLYGFDAASFGLSDKEAADIAVIFSKYDLNDDGIIGKDEFRKLCDKYSPEIQTDAELEAALALIDTNKDGSIDFNEFVRYWQGKTKSPALNG